jgi:hypothetical protein
MLASIFCGKNGAMFIKSAIAMGESGESEGVTFFFCFPLTMKRIGLVIPRLIHPIHPSNISSDVSSTKISGETSGSMAISSQKFLGKAMV